MSKISQDNQVNNENGQTSIENSDNSFDRVDISKKNKRKSCFKKSREILLKFISLEFFSGIIFSHGLDLSISFWLNMIVILRGSWLIRFSFLIGVILALFEILFLAFIIISNIQLREWSEFITEELIGSKEEEKKTGKEILGNKKKKEKKLIILKIFFYFTISKHLLVGFFLTIFMKVPIVQLVSVCIIEFINAGLYWLNLPKHQTFQLIQEGITNTIFFLLVLTLSIFYFN